MKPVPGYAARKIGTGGIVGVQDPLRIAGRRIEEPPLVGVVALDVPIPIQVVGRQVEQYTDVGGYRLLVRQLETGELQRHPVRLWTLHGDL
jgi:hypothetical protein